MARKGENIYKRKDGRYEGRYIKGYGANGKAKFGYICEFVWIMIGLLQKYILQYKTSGC